MTRQDDYYEEWRRRHGIDENVAPVGREHPETAHRAARRALPRTGSKRRAAWDWIDSRPEGATAEEVGDHFGWEHQVYSPTISTLAHDGHLEAVRTASGAPVTRLTRAGNDAQVYVTVRTAG